jgi:predicted enzyme related to lactoylglutathione lyase
MTTKTATVRKLASVIIPVRHQDRALEFYTQTVGLEKRADLPFGDDGRWIEVAPSTAETPIALCPPGPDGATGGKETGISLQTNDVEAFHAQLKVCGVDVDAEVHQFGERVPPLFWFRDPEGNRLMVVQGP